MPPSHSFHLMGVLLSQEFYFSRVVLFLVMECPPNFPLELRDAASGIKALSRESET